MITFQAIRKRLVPYLAPYFYIRAGKPVLDFLDRKAKVAYQRQNKTLNSLQQKIVGELNQNGLAITRIDELFPEGNWFSSLKQEAAKELENAKVGRKKSFLAYAWEGKAEFDLDNPFIKLALDEKILDIANSYLGMCSKLKFFSINRTLPENISREAGSQKWHRDNGVKKIIKMFIYFTNVEDAGAGPFTYALGSHLSGKYGKILTQELYGRYGIYPPDEEVEKRIDSRDIKPCLGKAGTVIFCDTLGLHKGGFSTKKERVMSTLLWEAPSAFGKPKFKYPTGFKEKIKDLPESSKFAAKT